MSGGPALRNPRVKLGLAALLVAFVLALSACGGDDEPQPVTTTDEAAETTTAPETTTTAPEATETEPEEEPTEPEESEEPEEPETTTTTPEDSGGGYGAGRPGRPPRDQPSPDPGSPEEAFERWCDENPQACG